MQFSSQDLLCIYPLHAEVVLLSHSRIKLVDATLTSAESCLPHCDSVLLSGCELKKKNVSSFSSFAARAAALAVCQRAECVPKKKTRPRGSCRCHRGCQADRPRAPARVWALTKNTMPPVDLPANWLHGRAAQQRDRRLSSLFPR